MTKVRSRNAMFVVVLALCGMGILAPAAVAQPVPPGGAGCSIDPKETLFSGFHLYEENDSLPLAGGDERYSQGLRVSISVNRKRLPCWVQAAEFWKIPGRISAYEPALTVFLGQGLYTPRIITSRVLEPNDRGFADFNYVGAELSVTARKGGWLWVRHALEGDIGFLGVEGLAKGAQGGLHSLKLSRIPKGWSTDGSWKPGLYTQYRTEVLFRHTTLSVWLPDVDLTVGPAIELGTVRISAGPHAVGRFGWNLSGFAPGGIRPAADGQEAPFFEFGALYGFEGRAIAHTSLVRATPGSQGFSRKSWVDDKRIGGFVRFGRVRGSYIRVDRSPEFTTPARTEGSQRFGSATLSYEPDIGASSQQPWHHPKVQAEVGMGRSFGGPKIDRAAVDPAPQGSVTGHLAVRVKAWRDFNVGGELGSVGVEGEPIPGEPANRTDVMLRQTALTVGWTKDVDIGTLGFRAGAAVKSAAVIQTIRHPVIDGQVEEVKSDDTYPVKKGGLLVGAQFFPHLERHVTIGLDLTYHRFGKVTGMPGLLKPSYLKAIILVQLRTD